MPLAYYSRAATSDFWTEHWGGHSVEELLVMARTSPLTRLITEALPSGGPMVEAGCGLGQYVLLLRERGCRAVGVDLSSAALRECRQRSPTAPLAVMDLHQLGIRSNSLSAYISLGVVEHDPEGPDAIVREARRVLEPNGVLILSVPYINGARRLGAWRIRRRNRQVREAGGEFYQFAFSRREAQLFIERNGFRVVSATPYDPARILRGALRSVIRLSGPGRVSVRPGRSEGGKPASYVGETGGRGSPFGVRSVLKRLLYTRPSLHAFGHMILFVALRVG